MQEREKKSSKPIHPKKTITPSSIEQGTGTEVLHPPERSFSIVALGASAGGLEAFSQFLNKMPRESGIALILLQHLDPSHASSLVDLLSRQTLIPIQEARDGDRVQPDHVYVIPPGKTMTIRNRTLVIEEGLEHPGITHNINLFLRSLAADVKERAVGIILSGSGSDGMDGVRAIKAQDGLVIVQDPGTAKFDGMPRSAIEAGLADYILSPPDMPAKLIEYLNHSYYKRTQILQNLKSDNPSLKNIFALVKARTRRDFSGYKISSINRRIEHRMMITKIDNIDEYLRLLKGNPTEVDNLMKDFLIQVTSFFRDGDAFDALKSEMDKLLPSIPEDSPIRAWVPGCSTGEEAYSIAIIILECIQESGRNNEVQVFATDLDPEAIRIARSGSYPDIIVQNVDPERRKRFFNQVDSSYQITKSVRDCVVFAVHDLVSDPPYSRMNLVSMRNLLIYFDSNLQKRVLPLLHYSLNEGGLLFLGTSESIGDFSNLFTIRDAKWRIYQSLGKVKFIPTGFTISPDMTSPLNQPRPVIQAQQKLDPILLLEALPPSIVVDRDYRVQYTHGDTSKYLRIAEGNPSDHILDMAKPETGRAMASLLHEVTSGKKEVVYENVQMILNSRVHMVKITMRPLSTHNGHVIITFEDVPGTKRLKPKGAPVTESRYQELEGELLRTRDTLRGTIEQLKTSNEELRSANEEYMSTNEELRSANEELETSREELQSVNEELTTLNTEDQKKNADLNLLNNDMQNLLNATGVATIFLDGQLHIRRYTPMTTKLFKFIDSDIGRPIEDITSPLKHNNLLESVKQVLEDLVPVEQEVQTTDDRWYSLRILPYRTLDNNIAGVVVSLIDINQLKSTLQYAQDIIDNIREPLLVLDDRLRVISASRAFYAKFLVSPEETIGQVLFELGNRQWDIKQLRVLLKEILEKDSIFEGYQVKHDFPAIGQRTMLLNIRRIKATQSTRNILLAMEDITDQTGIEPFSESSPVHSDQS